MTMAKTTKTPAGQTAADDSVGNSIDRDRIHLVRIDQIEVGTRHRKDMGDIAGLAANIEEHGLLLDLNSCLGTSSSTPDPGQRRYQ